MKRENVQRCVNVDKLVNRTITSMEQAVTVAESDQEVKFDQEASIILMRNTLISELHSVGGSSNVSKESPMSASTGTLRLRTACKRSRVLPQRCTVLFRSR